MPRPILIADGNDSDVQRLRGYLSETEYQVHIATNGTDALDCFARYNPHLVLLDPALTGINGFEICKRIKGDPSAKSTMILMVCNLDELGDIERAIDAGTNDFMAKPVNKTALLKRVDNLLKLHDCYNAD